jgi:hypothetical protein
MYHNFSGIKICFFLKEILVNLGEKENLESPINRQIQKRIRIVTFHKIENKN